MGRGRTFSFTTAPSREAATRSFPKASGWSLTARWAPKGPRPPGSALPRTGGSDRPSGSGSSPGRSPERGARPPSQRSIDADALRLRESGRSFAAIAQALGLKRATDARAAFLRALRTQPDDERVLIAARERNR